MIGRVHRMPQDKEVRVYMLFARLSAIDVLVKKLADEKQGTRNTVMESLIAHDDDPPRPTPG